MDNKAYNEWLDGYSKPGMDYETWEKRVDTEDRN